MIIAIGFLLPCLLYLLLYALTSLKVLPRAWPGGFSLAAAGVVAVSSLLVLLFVLRYSTDWSRGTQVEWTGFESVGQPLAVGGVREQAIVGWPNEAFSPV